MGCHLFYTNDRTGERWRNEAEEGNGGRETERQKIGRKGDRVEWKGKKRRGQSARGKGRW